MGMTQGGYQGRRYSSEDWRDVLNIFGWEALMNLYIRGEESTNVPHDMNGSLLAPDGLKKQIGLEKGEWVSGFKSAMKKHFEK